MTMMMGHRNHFLWIVLVVLSLVVQVRSRSIEEDVSFSVVLTDSNFDEVTKNKTVFLKYYAPWCPHCQELAPAWNRMAREWLNHDVGLVGQVDCTTQKQLCRDVEGLPTLYFGDASADGIFLQEYGDDKTYEALSEFANETLVRPFCTPVRMEACDETTRESLRRYLEMSVSELRSQIAQQEEKMEQAERDFSRAFKDLKAAYDTLGTKHSLKVGKQLEVLRLLKAIQNQQKANNKI